jgi:hypothetical protein
MTATKCRRCHRPLRDAQSIAAGYGPTCMRKVKAELADFTIEQTVKAVALVTDGAVTRIRGGVDALYQVRSGFRTYWTSYTDCTCTGARDHGSCYHIEAVRIWARNQRPLPAARRYVTAA